MDMSYNPIGNFQNVFKQNMTEIGNNNTAFLEGGIQEYRIDPYMISTDRQLKSDLGELSAPSIDKLDGAAKASDNFAQALNKSLNEVSNLETQANQAKETFMAGGDIDIHSVMIASQKANLSLQLAMQVRNKAIQAYNEIYRMNI